MIGKSPQMVKLREFIQRAARSDSNVLIKGESGTGKELVARALHFQGRRAAGPFVAVNCGALSEELLVSDLFGHERGSFTGAHAQKKGSFELADGGTLFLDEIGELTLRNQAALLRAIQEREIVRLGGTRSIRVDVRFIAATNRDLESAMACGGFRDDLYYRLNVLSVRTPALRERPEDILILAQHFVLDYAKEAGRTVRGLSSEAETILKDYHWPGNVRELQGVIQHAVAVGNTDAVLPCDLPKLQEVLPCTYRQTLRRFKRHIVEDVLVQANGDYRLAAERLGISPKSIHRCLNALGLRHLLR